MKKILLFLMFTITLQANSQLAVNILVPPGGMVDKQQLWNIIVTNPGTTTYNIRVQAVLTELSTGQPVLSATTSFFMLPAGTHQLSAAKFGTIQYNVLGGNYRIDPGPTGLLPVGTFTICYSFLFDNNKIVAQDCQQLNIQPLSPLLLTMPQNGAILEESHPTFGWLPFSTAQFLTGLNYSLKLVELYPNQSAADAAEKNIPLFTSRNLVVSQLLYAQNAPELQPNKQYAWQVVAMNNLSEITRSETWTFSIKPGATKLNLPLPDPVFIKLNKAGTQEGYAIAWGKLRFDYFNETMDSIWTILVEDLTTPQHSSFVLMLDSLKLKRGQNLVSYDALDDARFIDKHFYLLQVPNSRNEVWQLRFEYRKPD